MVPTLDNADDPGIAKSPANLAITSNANAVAVAGFGARLSRSAVGGASKPVAWQAALNLTTIDYTEGDADIQRLLDMATSEFYDDFQQRSKPFIDVVVGEGPALADCCTVGPVTVESALDRSGRLATC
jgi:hypothetical protein